MPADPTPGVAERLKAAARAARGLARLDDAARGAAVRAIADALHSNVPSILEANARDLAAARRLVESGELSQALFSRLRLDAPKLQGLVTGLVQVAELPDPVGRCSYAMELDEGLVLERVSCPLGVVAVIFESRPDVLPQVVSLCLRSGNAVVLKGGREAVETNRVLHEVIVEALPAAGVPAEAVVLLGDRADVATLLGADQDVALVIPRGGNALVRWVQEHTRIPVLGHAEGVCHVYVDRAADLGQALAVTVDAKVQYPAACNSAEAVLVHADVAAAFVPRLAAALAERGVELRADPRAAALAGRVPIVAATDADWGTEFGDLVLAVRVVDSLEEAIEHVARHGSRHTEAIVTGDDEAWSRFAAEVDAAGVFRNASTRFADGFRYGFGAEVGIATGRLHPRGPVGLDGLVTYKYRLTGRGHVVADYVGEGARPFRHQPLHD